MSPPVVRRAWGAIESDTTSAAADRSDRRLDVKSGVASIPHPDKASYGGEDAHFIMRCDGAEGASSVLVMGVADGVGGWNEEEQEDVDVAAYSREFMRNASDSAARGDGAGDIREVLDAAQRNTVAPGSATACLAELSSSGRLRAANLGDSGFRIVRGGKVVFASPAQLHKFNQPYQFAHQRFLPGTDTVKDAQAFEMYLEPGDVLVMASDGLFDNVYDEEVAEIVAGATSRGAGAGDIAERLAGRASELSKDPEYVSPFAIESAENGRDIPGWQKMLGRQLAGGKVDDITVVATIVE